MKLVNLLKNNKDFHAFDYLKNQKVVSISKLPQPEENPHNVIEDILGIDFGDACGLVIYNKYTYISIPNLKGFIGEKITDIFYSDIAVEFIFSSNKKIMVSLKLEDWNGPEAMQLNYKGKIYIWN